MGRDRLRSTSRPRRGLIALGALAGFLNYGLALALQALPLAALGFAPPEPEAFFAGQSRLEQWSLALACLFVLPSPQSAPSADVEARLALWAFVSATSTAFVLEGMRRLQAAPCGPSNDRHAGHVGNAEDKENAPSSV